MKQITYKTIVIRTEPLKDTYRQLLQFSCQHCKLFSLNWIEGGPLHIQKDHIADELKLFLVKEKSTQFGKFSLSHSYYRFTPQSSEIIARSETLYLWHGPGLPKDLTIYVDDEIPWLLSNTQNLEAYIFVQAIPFDEIRNKITFLDLEIEKPVLEIDGINFSTLDEFFNEIAIKLTPENNWWGTGLDGFNDMLNGGFGTPRYGFVLIWKNSQLSRERLGYPETIRQLQKRKMHQHPSWNLTTDQDLAMAKRSEGPSAFDWVTEIIESHVTIDLRLE
jgi:hypothetical protein